MATSSDRAKGQRRALLGDDDASMVFETSASVQVVPTFDSMGLRDDLLRGIYAYGEFCIFIARALQLVSPCAPLLRLREAVSYSAESHYPHCPGARRDSTGAVRDGEDGNLLHRSAAKSGHSAEGDPGAGAVANQRARSANTKGKVIFFKLRD